LARRAVVDAVVIAIIFGIIVVVTAPVKTRAFNILRKKLARRTEEVFGKHIIKVQSAFALISWISHCPS